MNRRFWTRTIAFLLSFIYVFSTPLSVYAENGDSQAVEGENSIEVEEAVEYLDPYEEAVEALNAVVAENEVYALVYLAESFAMKAEADPNSETVASLASGQEVQIIGVAEDSGQNIWYKVSYVYDEGTLEGYIKRANLATSNEYLLEWEAQYVLSRAVSFFAMRRAVSYPDVEQFPASYQDALYALKSQHPDWTFVKMNTGIDWNYAISVECEGSRSLIWAKTAEESWKNGMYDSSWAYCTPGIVKYYFDPRNSLTLETVFQFEHLGYNASANTEAVTQKAVDGTFMSGLIPGTSQTYANVLTSIGANINISPILLASRIRQEQGNDGTSPLISGIYPGYEGLYNYYNIGATGQTVEAVVTSGLAKAREQGWTSRVAALTGGAAFLLKNYISQGQDTLYLQKFDVDNRHNGVLWHQYMQNIQAPTTEAKSTYNTYKKTGLLDDMPFVFRIPVYENMPEYACIKPGSEDTIALSTSSVTNLPVNNTAVLITYINGVQNTTVEMSFTSSNTAVATVDGNGVITGISPGTATITCQKKENPTSANTVTCTVTVVKADIDVNGIQLPVLNELVYSPNTTLRNISLPAGYTWVDTSIVPTVVNSGYSVIYNPDSSKYNSLFLTLPLTVKKAQLDQTNIMVPTGLSAVAGTELKSVALPMGYTWDAPDTVLPKKTGTYSYTASYCADVANYEILTGISIQISITCKTHEFGEWTGNHADCVNGGKLVRSCNICGEQEVVTENATGHSYESKVTQEPTKTNVGIRTYTCGLCGDSYTEEIPKLEEAHKHSYTETVTKPATCLEKGEKIFSCSCGDSYTETVEALGHDVVDGTCSRCDYVEPSLPSHTHSYTASTVTATCTTAGVTIYTCGCGDTYSEELKALGHDMKDGECTRCDYTTNPPQEEKPSTSVNPSEEESSSPEETKPTTSVKPSEESSSPEETKPTTSVKPSEESSSPEETKPTTSVKPSEESSSSEETKPTTSVKPSEETKPSTSGPDSSKEESKPVESSTANTTTNTTTSSSTTTNTTTNTTTSSSTTTNTTADNNTVTNNPPSNSEENGEEPSGELLQPLMPESQSNITTQQPSANLTPYSIYDPEESEASAEEKLQTVQINMNESTVLDADKLTRVREGDKKLQLNMPDSITWNIDLASIEDVENLNVNMAVTMGKADVPKDVIATVASDEHYELMTLEHEGEFGFDAVLSVPVKEQYIGMIANLFYYNPETGALEFIGASKVTSAGYASFEMQHASEYVIVFANASLDPGLEESVVEESAPVELDTTEAAETENAETISTRGVVIVVAVILLLAAIISAVMVLMKKRKEDYFFDEEDDPDDDTIK